MFSSGAVGFGWAVLCFLLAVLLAVLRPVADSFFKFDSDKLRQFCSLLDSI